MTGKKKSGASGRRVQAACRRAHGRMHPDKPGPEKGRRLDVLWDMRGRDGADAGTRWYRGTVVDTRATKVRVQYADSSGDQWHNLEGLVWAYVAPRPPGIKGEAEASGQGKPKRKAADGTPRGPVFKTARTRKVEGRDQGRDRSDSDSDSTASFFTHASSSSSSASASSCSSSSSAFSSPAASSTLSWSEDEEEGDEGDEDGGGEDEDRGGDEGDGDVDAPAVFSQPAVVATKTHAQSSASVLEEPGACVGDAAETSTAACASGLKDRHLGQFCSEPAVVVQYVKHGELCTGSVTDVTELGAFACFVVTLAPGQDHGVPFAVHSLANGDWTLWPQGRVPSPDHLPCQPRVLAARRLQALVALCKLRRDADAAQYLGVGAANQAAAACARAVVLAREPSAGDSLDCQRVVRTYIQQRAEAAAACTRAREATFTHAVVTCGGGGACSFVADV